ncbi:TlpA family protein disulfide reductase [Polaribacter sargassicola]|uniref:TlpA family protein disulfide reductase n=1 Tax=Polaribacter sargassicola TaxID=2836891 RepID=UPI001F296250|nr:TlpA disulfide reductase family protein [Polaribacter sp. DS7-9]MCG1035936.1 TlpA family protein disulfide reductase [Polaribacter sp. DS7-9]
MFKKITILAVLLLFVSCNLEKPTEFTEKALNEKVYNLNGVSSSFKDVLKEHKGKKILIDIWAGWCRDCLKGMPRIKDLQRTYPDVVFLFLSVDERKSYWKKAIEHYNIKGVHYNLPKGMKEGDLVDFLDVSWIPRYLVVDENGKIILFNVTKAYDKRIKDALD